MAEAREPVSGRIAVRYCNDCGQAFRPPAPVAAGVLVRCPACSGRGQVPVPAPGSAPALPPRPGAPPPVTARKTGPPPRVPTRIEAAPSDTIPLPREDGGRGCEVRRDDPPAGAPAPSDTLPLPADEARPAPAPAAETVEPIDVEPADPTTAAEGGASPGPRRFGPYELVKELGRGGMGVVYKAWHPEMQAHYAVKVLLAGGGASLDAVKRFKREAEAAARLRHPGVVAVHSIGEQDGRTYFAMEYVEGPSLDKVIADPRAVGLAPAPGARPSVATARAGASGRPRVPWGIEALAAARLTRDVADALQAAHEAKIIHRDLKPANVLLERRTGQVKVMDFGLAKLADGSKNLHTRTGAVIGTPAYMSPEQADGRLKELDARSDVYQIGAILYELLTGHPPYEGKTSMDILLKAMQEDVRRPRDWNATIPADVEAICLKALARERRERYATARELADDLGRFLAAEPVAARPVSTVARLGRRVARRRREIVWGSVAAAACIGLGVYGLTAPQARVVTEEEKRAQAAARDIDGVLLQARALVTDANVVLHRADLPVAGYREKLGQAVKVVEEAMARHADAGWLYEARGRLLLRCEDLTAAEADLKKALDLLGPQRGKAARRSLGRLYLERWVDAVAERAAAAGAGGQGEADAATGRSADAWRARAVAEFAAAQGEIEWRGGGDEGQGLARLAEAIDAWARGEMGHAADVLRAGAERDGDADCAWALAVISAQPKDRDRWLEQALKSCPRHPRALLERGRARSAAGDHDGALADYQAALAAVPGSAASTAGRERARKARVEELATLRRAAEAARAAADAAFKGARRPATFERADAALAEGTKALAAEDQAAWEAARKALREAAEGFAQAQAEAPAYNTLSDAEKAWSVALAATDEKLLAQYAAGELRAARLAGSEAERKITAEGPAAAASGYQQAAAALSAAVAKARVAQVEAEAKAKAAQVEAETKAKAAQLEAEANAKAKMIAALLTRLDAAILQPDVVEAVALLAELEKVIPGDARLDDLRKRANGVRTLVLDLGAATKLEFILVPAGTFVMGGAAPDIDTPSHKVTLTKPFYLGKFEVTQDQWQAVMGANPSSFKGPKNPVDSVSWDDCQAFLGKLKAKFPAYDFRLPTEAQWEYACRAGTTTEYSFGDDDGKSGEYAWHDENSGRTTHPVGVKKPNAWGIYDMQGNIKEWCSDWYGPYPGGDDVDPTGPPSGTYRVVRGGSYNDIRLELRSFYRSKCYAVQWYIDLGMRVVAMRSVAGTH